jgi:uncharacterized protein (UPF0262 family)
MMLFVDGIIQGVYHPNIGYLITSYEAAFEQLTQLVAEGWGLEYAIIIDEGNTITLPVEAFDGQPIEVHIATLQQQWAQLLREAPDKTSTRLASSRSSIRERLKDHLLSLDAYYARLLIHLEKMIFMLEVRKAKLARKHSETMRTKLSQQYDSLLGSNRRIYSSTLESRTRNAYRI